MDRFESIIDVPLYVVRHSPSSARVSTVAPQQNPADLIRVVVGKKAFTGIDNRGTRWETAGNTAPRQPVKVPGTYEEPYPGWILVRELLYENNQTFWYLQELPDELREMVQGANRPDMWRTPVADAHHMANCKKRKLWAKLQAQAEANAPKLWREHEEKWAALCRKYPQFNP